MKMFTLTLVSAAMFAAPAAFAQEFQEAGSELKLGESATVPHLVPNGPQVPIELTVTAIEEGSMDDLAGFDIPADLRNARPVYVRYEYTNRSDEDLANQQIGAFVAIDDRDQTHSPALAMNSATTDFTQCRADVPRQLGPGESAEGCVMFMLHEDGAIEAAAYQGSYRHETGKDTQADYPIYYDPIRWTADAQQDAGSGTGGTIVR